MSGTRIFILVAIIAAIGAGGVLYWSRLSTTPAPAVTFVSIKGERISTADLRGRVVLVNFWATDCAICLKEMPGITATYDKYHARGFEAIAVAMRYDPPNRVLHYVGQNRLPFRVALDPIGELARAFGEVKLTPTTFIIDRQGRIVSRVLGELDFVKLHALIERELAQAGTR